MNKAGVGVGSTRRSLHTEEAPAGLMMNMHRRSKARAPRHFSSPKKLQNKTD